MKYNALRHENDKELPKNEQERVSGTVRRFCRTVCDAGVRQRAIRRRRNDLRPQQADAAKKWLQEKKKPGAMKVYAGKEMKPVQMERGRVYNVRRGTWHGIVVEPNTKVLVVENAGDIKTEKRGIKEK